MEILPQSGFSLNNYSTSPVQNISSGDIKKNEKDKLIEKCLEFESVLINSMLKSMRNTVEKSDLFSGGHAEEIYTSMLDQQYSLLISKNSRTGIAEDIYRQLTRDDSTAERDNKEAGDVLVEPLPQ